jgi:hypothetical protein
MSGEKSSHPEPHLCDPGLIRSPNATFVATTYGHWDVGEQPYVLSVRFRLDEIDARMESL